MPGVLVVVDVPSTGTPPKKLVNRLENAAASRKERRQSLTNASIDEEIDQVRARRRFSEMKAINRIKSAELMYDLRVTDKRMQERLHADRLHHQMQTKQEQASAFREFLRKLEVERCRDLVDHAKDVSYLQKLKHESGLIDKQLTLESMLRRAECNRHAFQAAERRRLEALLTYHEGVVEAHRVQEFESAERLRAWQQYQMQLHESKRREQLAMTAAKNKAHIWRVKSVAFDKSVERRMQTTKLRAEIQRKHSRASEIREARLSDVPHLPAPPTPRSARAARRSEEPAPGVAQSLQDFESFVTGEVCNSEGAGVVTVVRSAPIDVADVGMDAGADARTAVDTDSTVSALETESYQDCARSSPLDLSEISDVSEFGDCDSSHSAEF